jgi:hypothetical protein
MGVENLTSRIAKFYNGNDVDGVLKELSGSLASCTVSRT